jgi:hypothetical protein
MDQNVDVQRSLGRIEGKTDQILSEITKHETHDEIRFNSMEKRLGSLERKIWYASGVAAVIVLVLSKLTLSSLTL